LRRKVTDVSVLMSVKESLGKRVSSQSTERSLFEEREREATSRFAIVLPLYVQKKLSKVISINAVITSRI
jgi:hypothetical protein